MKDKIVGPGWCICLPTAWFAGQVLRYESKRFFGSKKNGPLICSCDAKRFEVSGWSDGTFWSENQL